jgi:hypothetical protein
MSDLTVQGDADLARVTELVRLADRLGLRWGLRPGTVVSVSSPYDTREVSARMDGDDVGITVVSLVEDLALGDRIMVVWVPSAGQYAIGRLNSPATTAFAAAATSNTATIVAETVVLTITSVTLRKGTAYRVEAGVSHLAAATINAFFRVRKTNIAGAVWATSTQFLGNGAIVNAPAQWAAYITPTVDIVNTPVVLTMTASGTGSVYVGSAAAPRYFSITGAGRAADYPQAVQVS